MSRSWQNLSNLGKISTISASSWKIVLFLWSVQSFPLSKTLKCNPDINVFFYCLCGRLQRKQLSPSTTQLSLQAMFLQWCQYWYSYWLPEDMQGIVHQVARYIKDIHVDAWDGHENTKQGRSRGRVQGSATSPRGEAFFIFTFKITFITSPISYAFPYGCWAAVRKAWMHWACYWQKKFICKFSFFVSISVIVAWLNLEPAWKQNYKFVEHCASSEF